MAEVAVAVLWRIVGAKDVLKNARVYIVPREFAAEGEGLRASGMVSW